MDPWNGPKNWMVCLQTARTNSVSVGNSRAARPISINMAKAIMDTSEQHTDVRV